MRVSVSLFNQHRARNRRTSAGQKIVFNGGGALKFYLPGIDGIERRQWWNPLELNFGRGKVESAGESCSAGLVERTHRRANRHRTVLKKENSRVGAGGWRRQTGGASGDIRPAIGMGGVRRRIKYDAI